MSLLCFLLLHFITKLLLLRWNLRRKGECWWSLQWFGAITGSLFSNGLFTGTFGFTVQSSELQALYSSMRQINLSVLAIVPRKTMNSLFVEWRTCYCSQKDNEFIVCWVKSGKRGDLAIVPINNALSWAPTLIKTIKSHILSSLLT